LDFSIGEFSRITGLSIKALRLYHEKGILIPGHIDPSTNYRYYDSANVDKAKIIVYLRNMEFSLPDIKDILSNYDDEADLVEALVRQKERISEKGELCKKSILKKNGNTCTNLHPKRSR
jgi:DNA-binding transcriptional MerR regulator